MYDTLIVDVMNCYGNDVCSLMTFILDWWWVLPLVGLLIIMVFIHSVLQLISHFCDNLTKKWR